MQSKQMRWKRCESRWCEGGSSAHQFAQSTPYDVVVCERSAVDEERRTHHPFDEVVSHCPIIYRCSAHVRRSNSIIGCITIEQLRSAACDALPSFLAHVYPRVRADDGPVVYPVADRLKQVRMITAKELAETSAASTELQALLEAHNWSEDGDAAQQVVEMLRRSRSASKID